MEQISKIIVDTRERLPLWEGKNVIRRKISEGDYSTEKLHNIVHIERKSPIDLYGSIIQGHKRFVREIKRAAEKDIKLIIFVECPKAKFFAKEWPRGSKMRCGGSILTKIINTMEKKYNLLFVWCNGRNDMRNRMLFWFKQLENEASEITRD